MQQRSLPPFPDLEQYKNIAKSLVKAWRSDTPTRIPWEGSAVTVTREHIAQLYPRFANSATREFSLAGAQYLIASQYGFSTWADFAREVESRSGGERSSDAELPTAERRVVHTHHVLAVKDLAVAATYFKDKLGFKFEFDAPGWEFLSYGTFKVMLGECADAMSARETGDHSYFAHCLVENVDDVYAELRARGAEVIHPIGDKPWGLREFSVATPDGHRITYGQVL